MAVKDAQRKMIFQAFAIGVTKDTDAITYAGVSREWYYKELRDNPTFAHQVEEAKTKRKMRALGVIMEAAKTSWAAAGWFLERTYQEEFAIKQRHEVSGPGGAPLPVMQTKIPDLTPAMMKKLASMVTPEANGNGNGQGHHTVAGTGA